MERPSWLGLLAVLIAALATMGCGSEDRGAAAGAGGTAGGGTGGVGTAGAGGDGGTAGVAGAGGDGGVGGTGGNNTGGTGGFSAPDPNAIDLVEAALEAGDISDIDALRYKVFAVFGDSRLPEMFRSAEPMQDGTLVLVELAENFDGLSVEIQSELDPFLRAPADPLSWYQLRAAATRFVEKDHNSLFDHVDAVDGDVLVHWPRNLGHLQADAIKVAETLTGSENVVSVWDTLTTFMGTEPVRDDGIVEKYNGGDGRYDIYIIDNSIPVMDPNLQTAFGWTAPYRASDDDGIVTFLVMNRDQIASAPEGFDTKMKSNLAHEFMHVLQFARKVSGRWEDYSWLMESTSTWVEHFVFPGDNLEHADAPAYLRRPDVTISSTVGTHEYGAYLYWFFLTERPGGDDSIVSDVWSLAESMTAIEAANAAIEGGFSEAFVDFAVANWNQAPFNNSGNTPYDVYMADGMTSMANASRSSPSATPEATTEVVFPRGGVPRVSAQYVHYDLTSAGVRTVLFANGYTFKLDEGLPEILDNSANETLFATRMPAEDRANRKVIALMKQNGTWLPDPYDLTDVAFAPFCQQANSESLEELVLIFINTEHREDEPFFATPTGLNPRILTSNMGCGNWVGTAGARQTVIDGSDLQTMVLDIENIEFSRETSTIAKIVSGEGQIAFGDEILPPSTVPSLQWFVGDVYELSDLQATWSYDEEYSVGAAMCEGSGVGTMTEAQAFASTFQLGTHLRQVSGTPSPPALYRSFYLQLTLLTDDTPISGQCVSNGQPSPYTDLFTVTLAGGYRNTPEFGQLVVDPGGGRINVTWSVDTVDMDLDVTSVAIP